MATRLLTEAELAERLGMSIHFLRADRRRKRRFSFMKIGRSVRYDEGVVDAELPKYLIGGSERPTTVLMSSKRGPSKSSTKRR
jgi:hypothetical protein